MGGGAKGGGGKGGRGGGGGAKKSAVDAVFGGLEMFMGGYGFSDVSP